MQIDRILYPVYTLGPGKRIAIWTIGCPHHCKNCSNPELWDVNKNKDISIPLLLDMILEYSNICDGVTITGGEPFLQGKELEELLYELRKYGYKDILVYSGYSYSYLKQKYEWINSLVDVLIDGAYIDELNDNKGIRGSSNQNIYVLESALSNKYYGYSDTKRKRQNFYSNGKIVSAGIPLKTKNNEEDFI